MKNLLIAGTISLAAAAVLTGCGSSGTSTAENNLETGYFIDAPVEGLAYETASGHKGVTDKYGRFQYQNGEKVRFMIGKLHIGEATPDQEGLVTPETIAQNDETLKVQLLRVLQALDSDNDPSNGITISPEVVTALNSMTQKVELQKVKEDDKLLKLNSTLAEHLDEDYDGRIDIDENRAKTHFDNSISQWKSGHKPDANAIGQNQGNGNGQGEEKGHGNEKGNGNGQGQVEHIGGMGAFDLSQYPTSTLTQDVKDALAYMGNEERLAYDVYMNLYNYYTEQGKEIRQFQNIAQRSESKHIAIVQDLVRRYNLSAADVTNVENPVVDNSVAFENMPMGQYDVPAIQELYAKLYAKGTQSVQDALEVGCMVEVTDVDDLDKYIGYASEANATDVLAGFEILRNGSYNHYWAFDKGLKNMGVAEGCGVLGEKYAKTEVEYPKNH